MEQELRHVYSEMMKMREREEEMRNMSEMVNSRVAWRAAPPPGGLPRGPGRSVQACSSRRER